MKFTRSILEAYLAVALLVLTITAFILLRGVGNSEAAITNILLLIIAGILILNTMLSLRFIYKK